MILKSGERIEGKITNQSRTKIELQKEDGTKLVIDKDKIEKIQYGPSQREIEEKKRKEEEQRRKEERLRQEEERRRIEEERKKKEEEKRQLEEEQLKKEAEECKKLEIRKKEIEKIKNQIQKTPISIVKREGWEIGYGGGPVYNIPSFLKIYDLFFYMFTSDSIIFHIITWLSKETTIY